MEHETSDGPAVWRDRVTLSAGSTLVAVLLGMAGTAWLLSVRLAKPDMRLGVLTQAPMASGSQMGMPGGTSMGLGVFIATWAVMMVAMMIPSFIPAVRTFDARLSTTGPSGGAPVLFTVGYLLVWSALGGLAYLAVHALQTWLPAGNMTALRVGALLLVVAGLYQLTPAKQTCLRHCRSPHRSVAPPPGSQVLGYLSALRAGLWSGVYCLGSSWPLMLVLLLVGMMNLAWMTVIAGAILVEKAMPGGIVFGKLVGCGLAGWGIILLAAPHTVPVLGGA